MAPLLLDLAYSAVVLLLSPWLLYRAITTGRYRRGLAAKLLGLAPDCTSATAPLVWFHGVSVGEIHLLRQVIAQFRRARPDCYCLVSTTTDTGYAEASRAFPDLIIFYFPLDFSWAVRRALRRLRPALLVLAEGELWPNLLLAAKGQRVPVAVINARLSPRSLARYRWLGSLSGKLLRCIDVICAQTPEYVDAFRQLGARSVQMTGNVKYDGVRGDRSQAATDRLRHLLNVAATELVLVAGSTQPPEERLALAAWQRLRETWPTLRLFLVPRQADRFEEVAALLQQSGVAFARRSQLTAPTDRPVVLIDTIGELGALWGLADVAFVGGSLDGRRGGQNMIEPAAYGAAVVFGPHVWNFKAVAASLLSHGAAVQIDAAEQLEPVLRCLLADADERARLGIAAHAFVASQQGATQRTVGHLCDLLQRGARQLDAA